eukprot:CAMPEP_0115457646 /NCGR_PEP_ID=MMETSP0271-20121206/45325_1 /TAXON_ID=71861 /ORGANISM="Scrippsiella trochoidea, Strain CCMP3099" /LENGTH=201 /DNA_ID=CAMNT_0002884227 /DNA_START=51 /DNA_END=656 /DNA_ORIENTATION=-
MQRNRSAACLSAPSRVVSSKAKGRLSCLDNNCSKPRTLSAYLDLRQFEASTTRNRPVAECGPAISSAPAVQALPPTAMPMAVIAAAMMAASRATRGCVSPSRQARARSVVPTSSLPAGLSIAAKIFSTWMLLLPPSRYLLASWQFCSLSMIGASASSMPTLSTPSMSTKISVSRAPPTAPMASTCGFEDTTMPVKRQTSAK